jgi:Cof subfamily protein (haloacid dehalogenase superfamily)
VNGFGFKLVILDLDGTLLDPAGAVTPRVREAIRAARDIGCVVTLASGRRLWAVRPIVEDLGISAPVILYNGALVYDMAGEQALINDYLPAEPLGNALDLIWGHGFQPVLYGHPLSGELVYTGPAARDTPATAHYFDRPTVQPFRLDPEELRVIPRPPLLAAMGEENEMRALESAIVVARLGCETLVEQQSFVPRSPWWQLDVSARGCSKGSALRRLCELYGIELSETLAVGDGINDLDLIRSAGLGIAMGNAVPEIVQAAAVRVSDNANDGAAEALERYILGAALSHGPSSKGG